MSDEAEIAGRLSEAEIRERAAIWRCGVSDAVIALDPVLFKWRHTKSLAVRKFRAELDKAIQAVVDMRCNVQPATYQQAFEAGKTLHAEVRHLLERPNAD